jgi:hypothetical protein
VAPVALATAGVEVVIQVATSTLIEKFIRQERELQGLLPIWSFASGYAQIRDEEGHWQ